MSVLMGTETLCSVVFVGGDVFGGGVACFYATFRTDTSVGADRGGDDSFAVFGCLDAGGWDWPFRRHREDVKSKVEGRSKFTERSTAACVTVTRITVKSPSGVLCAGGLLPGVISQ